MTSFKPPIDPIDGLPTLEAVAHMPRTGLMTLDSIRECLATIAKELLVIRNKVSARAPTPAPTPAPAPAPTPTSTPAPTPKPEPSEAEPTPPVVPGSPTQADPRVVQPLTDNAAKLLMDVMNVLSSTGVEMTTNELAVAIGRQPTQSTRVRIQGILRNAILDGRVRSKRRKTPGSGPGAAPIVYFLTKRGTYAS